MRLLILATAFASAFSNPIGTLTLNSTQDSGLQYTLSVEYNSSTNTYVTTYSVYNNSVADHNIGAVGFHVSNDIDPTTLSITTNPTSWSLLYGKLDGNGGCDVSPGGNVVCAEGTPTILKPSDTASWQFSFSLLESGSLIQDWGIKAQEDANEKRGSYVGNLMSDAGPYTPYQTDETSSSILLAVGVATILCVSFATRILARNRC